MTNTSFRADGGFVNSSSTAWGPVVALADFSSKRIEGKCVTAFGQLRHNAIVMAHTAVILG